MSLLETNFDAVKELKAVPDGSEVKLRILRCDTNEEGQVIRTNKNGDPYFMPRFEIADNPYAKEFNYYMPVQSPKLDEKTNNDLGIRLQRFYRCFGIKATGAVEVDLEKDLPGKVGWAILSIEEDDYDGGQRNRVKRWILPKA